MPNTIHISPEELLQQTKLSCQMPAMIEGIVSRQIVLSTAAEAGLQLSTDELQQAADAFRANHHLFRSDQTQGWIQAHHLSLDEFEAIVRLSALSSKLAQHLFAPKVEPFFAEHQLDYAQVVMYEITLDDEDLAMELFYAIQENEMSFYDVAHHYIQDPELRRSSGYRGLLSRRDLKPEISAAVFAATPPQLLKPIVTAKAAHLILVEEILQPTLDKALSQKILSDLFLQWLKQQTAHAEIVISDLSNSVDRPGLAEPVRDGDRTPV